MLNFVIGLLFLIINFQVKIPYAEGTIEVLPTFLGYMFIFNGILRLRKENKNFEEIKYLSLSMIVYTFIFFATTALDIEIVLPIPSLNAGAQLMAYTAIPQFILFKIIWGIVELDAKFEKDLQSDRLKMLFIYNMIIVLVRFILKDTSFNFILISVNFILNLTLIFYLYRTHLLYKEIKGSE